MNENKVRRSAYGAALFSSGLSALYMFASWWSVRDTKSDWLLKYVAQPVIGMFSIALLYNILHIAYALIGNGLKFYVIARTRLVSVAVFCGVSVPIIAVGLLIGAWIRK